MVLKSYNNRKETNMKSELAEAAYTASPQTPGVLRSADFSAIVREPKGEDAGTVQHRAQARCGDCDWISSDWFGRLVSAEACAVDEAAAHVICTGHTVGIHNAEVQLSCWVAPHYRK